MKRLFPTVIAGIVVALSGASSSTVSAQHMQSMKATTGHNAMQMTRSRYGGPVYMGKPHLSITSSFIAAGGGPAHFSTAAALTSMAGANVVNKEVAKLTKQYGDAKVKSWLTVFDFAVTDAIRLATAAHVTLPKPTLHGKALAAALVKEGLDNTNTFYTEYMLDKLVTHNIHNQVMIDIDQKYGAQADANYHAVTNQAMVDLAHALGMSNVKLAKFH